MPAALLGGHHRRVFRAKQHKVPSPAALYRQCSKRIVFLLVIEKKAASDVFLHSYLGIDRETTASPDATLFFKSRLMSPHLQSKEWVAPFVRLFLTDPFVSQKP